MESNIKEIMKELNSDIEERSDGPSTSVTMSRNRMKLSRSDTQHDGGKGEKRKRLLPDSIDCLYDKLSDNDKDPNPRKRKRKEGTLV